MGDPSLEMDDVRLCNCASCGQELMGESMRTWRKTLTAIQRQRMPKLVAGRLEDRPYCAICLGVLQRLTTLQRERLWSGY